MRILCDSHFIVRSGNANADAAYVVAPAGWTRAPDGTVYRDIGASPEVGTRANAYRFKSHRSAARTASRLANASVLAVHSATT